MAERKISLAAVVPLALFVVLALAFGISFLREDKEALPSVYIDRPAPPLETIALEGYPVLGPEDISAPQIKLVNFFASWCPPCRAEHPQLMKLKEEGWTIIGVNKTDELPNAQGFLRELGNPYAVIGADPRGRASIEWGVYGLPETFIVDAQGHIRFRFPGAVTPKVWEERFLPIIEAIRAGG